MTTRMWFPLFLIGCWLAPILSATSITVGSDSGLEGATCVPFGCAANSASRYQQIYTRAAFLTVAYVDVLSFTVEHSISGNRVDSGTFDIYLSAASTTLQTLSPTLAFNPGTAPFHFGTFSVGGTIGNTLSFAGTPFLYDPSAGDLLMDVLITSVTRNPGGNATFEVTDTSGILTRRAYGNDAGAIVSNTGLVTTFETSSPEPVTMVLIAGGLSLALISKHRRH